MIPELKVWLLAAAGVCYVVAALLRWHHLSRDSHARRPWLFLVCGLGAHLTAALLNIIGNGSADFTYATMGSLFAALAILIGTRFMAVNTPGLLLLPVGAMSLLAAVFAALDLSRTNGDLEERAFIFFIHIIFMSANLAAVLLASAAAGLYLVVSRQLKAASQRALRLPQLPPLGRLAQRSLLLACAMQIGGVVSGAVAVNPDSQFTVFHPTVTLAVLSLILMILLLVLQASARINYRALSWGIGGVLAVEVAALITLMVVPPHG